MTRILLVEDNEMNRDMLSRRLSRKGFDVIEAISGEAGIEAAEREKPDLILMDIGLPGLDGLEATRTLRRKGFTTPVIALTAHAMTDDRTRAIEAGCSDFDTKPVDLARLLEKIHSALANAGGGDMHDSA